jgi:ferrochelatase
MKENEEGRRGIVLLQMGGPERLDDIEPFLRNLFADRNIIPLPGPAPLRRMLAALIANRRARKVAGRYRAIGGGSPLVRITQAQAAALEQALSERGIPAAVRAAMRYSAPRTTDVVEALRREGIRRFTALSLYPHYSRTTTGSSLDDLREALAASTGATLEVIDRWGDDPAYARLLADRITAGVGTLRREAGGEVRVILSAHGLPVRVIESGDPYLAEVERTAAAVGRLLGDIPWRLSFQSRLGPVKWLEPTTGSTIAEAAGDGVRGLLLVPLGFVSDHIETLYDLDIVYREEAARAGIPHYRRLAAFNTDPVFIALLASLAAGGPGRA